MSSDRPEQPLTALIEKWREHAKWIQDRGAAEQWRRCASELEAALLVGRQTPPDQETTEEMDARLLSQEGCSACDLQSANIAHNIRCPRRKTPASRVLPQQDRASWIIDHYARHGTVIKRADIDECECGATFHHHGRVPLPPTRGGA